MRDKRTFIEDYVLAVTARPPNSHYTTTKEAVWLAEKVWEEIEKKAPYER